MPSEVAASNSSPEKAAKSSSQEEKVSPSSSHNSNLELLSPIPLKQATSDSSRQSQSHQRQPSSLLLFAGIEPNSSPREPPSEGSHSSKDYPSSSPERVQVDRSSSPSNSKTILPSSSKHSFSSSFRPIPTKTMSSASPSLSKNLAPVKESPSPTSESLPETRHERNLSEQFTSLASVASSSPTPPVPFSSSSAATNQDQDRQVGSKHRRMFSGDLPSSTSAAHRRLNSLGEAAEIARQAGSTSGGGARKSHKRVDSAGLDVLTAAVDQEELSTGAPKRTTSAYDYRPSYRRSPTSYHPPHAHHSNAYPYAPQHPHPHHPGYGPPPHHHPHHSPYGPPQGMVPGPHYMAYPHHQASSGYRGAAPGPSPYPMQYARPPHPSSEAASSTHKQARTESRNSPLPHKEGSSSSSNSPRTATMDMMTAPESPVIWKGQGTQTFVTTIGVGDGANKTIVPSSHHSPLVERHQPGHHRKLSSFSNVAAIFGESPLQHPLKKGSKDGHHRHTSSSISFLGDLQVDASDAAFLQNLQATGAPGPAFPLQQHQAAPPAPLSPIPTPTPGPKVRKSTTKLASGGSSKRVRRKCTVGDCPNRVVQGGLCIAHGAQRKKCKHPGCEKNVKKAGLCSTHGPARKRCEFEGCSKVAVQGGRCIAHGAKKKLCSVDLCNKQAILGGMCKKHNDQKKKAAASGRMEDMPKICQPVSDAAASSSQHKPSHTRGLSIFQDLSADAVGNILQGADLESVAGARGSADGKQHRHRSTLSREIGKLF